MNAWGWRATSTFCLACVLSLALQGTAALAANGKGAKGLTLSSFTLKGTHGYKLEAVSFHEGTAATTAGVVAKRGDSRASYEMAGQGGLGIHANLGSLGRVEVRFHRRGRSVEQISKGCRIVVETGIFRGEFEFDGENGYTHGAARSAQGAVLRLPNGFCLFDDLKGPARHSILATTTLSARSRTANGSIELAASRLDVVGDLSVTATVHEKVGALTIVRTVSANPPKRALEIGSEKPPRDATLKPGAPFSGEGQFEHAKGSPPAWTGSLSVSLPGAPAVALTGPQFATRLCVGKSLFESCRATLPPPAVPPEPQL